MEALEELQEMNKREVKINYDEMLSKYDKLRQVEAAKEEEEDDWGPQLLHFEPGLDVVEVLLDTLTEAHLDDRLLLRLDIAVHEAARDHD